MIGTRQIQTPPGWVTSLARAMPKRTLWSDALPAELTSMEALRWSIRIAQRA